MAVYTHLSAERMSDLIANYDVGALVSAKGIAEGVSNSNWLVETTGQDGSGARFILTMYERRITLEDLPFFLDLLDHLAEKGCPVPRTIHDRNGAAFRMVYDKAVALIEFLPGLSVDRPSAEQARSAGKALAGMHHASQDFAGTRTNDLGLQGVSELFEKCSGRLAEIDPDLPQITARHMPAIKAAWPDDLPKAIAHTDLFPDNVLVEGDQVNALIDFYFAAREAMAYDLAVTHLAWSFEPGGGAFRRDVGDALIAGYQSIRTLSDKEREALPTLAKAAAMRFIATRSYDWLFTPDDALVTRKDPMEFVQRLKFYDEAGHSVFAFAEAGGT